jgi:DNA-binding CsgD family transcriptional regulator
MTTLWLDFAGVGYAATSRLAFGRSAELALDEHNRFMHRVTGEFRWNGSVWWLYNVGSSTRLLVFGANGARIELPPGTECALPMPTGSVSFVAGPTPYQLLYRVDEPTVSTRAPKVGGDATVEFGTALTDRETIYLTTFAINRLRGTSAALLSYADVAQLWGVSEKTVDNTLQRVRSRMKEDGVRNTETLEGLVNHLLAHGRIGLSTLVAIEADHPGVLPA